MSRQQPIEAELYDGTVLEFPSGTDPSVIQRVVKQQTAQRRESAAQSGAEPSEPRDAPASFINRGISEVLGAPVNAMNALIPEKYRSEKPFLGSESIASGIREFGIGSATQAPESMLEHIAYGTGAAVGGIVPIAKGAQALSRGTGIVGQMAGEMAAPYLTSPGMAVASELGAGAGAGVGTSIAEGSDNPYVKAAAPLLYGVIGGMAPQVARTLSPTLNAGRLAKSAYTEWKNPMRSAENRVAGALQDRMGADKVDIAKRLMATSKIEGQSLAQQSGSDTLMTLERAVAGRNDQDARLFAEGLENVTARGTRQIEQMAAPNSPEFYATEALDAADAQLSKYGALQKEGARSPELATKASQATDAYLKEGLKAARTEESRLWNLIPRQVKMTLSNARTAMNKMLATTPEAQRPHIPDFASRKLRSGTPASEGDMVLDGFLNVGDPDNPMMISQLDLDPGAAAQWADSMPAFEIHGLYSELRASARGFRGAGQYMDANFADEIADALWKDLTVDVKEPGVAALYNNARKYSAELNSVFRRGKIGKLLGFTGKQADIKTSPEALLESAIQAPGSGIVSSQAAVDLDDLRKAASFGAQTGQTSDVAINAFLKNRFGNHAVIDGKLSAKNARNFIDANSEVLDRFPRLKRDFQVAARIQSDADSLMRIRTDFGDVMRSITPRREVEALLKLNPSDKARQAMRSGLIDFSFGSSQRKTPERMLQMLNDRHQKGVFEALFSKGEMEDLRLMGKEIESVLSQVGQPLGADTGIHTAKNELLNYAAGTAGARIGARFGRGTSGASLRTSSRMAQLFEKGLDGIFPDEADKVIVDALKDKTLLHSLLTRDLGDRSAFATWNRWIDNFRKMKVKNMMPPAIAGIMSQQTATKANEIMQSRQQQ
jgi:hypothetical protein